MLPMVTASRQPNFALFVAAAWLLAMLQLLLQYWPDTASALNDTDDAMRLVELREFLAGHGWFDLHMARVQPPMGYDPHWSRLIDAGLAGLFIVLHQFLDGAVAERVMRALWPMLWLLPAMIGAAAIAWRIAGRAAALVLLLLVVIGLPALQQFKPGRIDHHNVQIAIVMLTAAAVVWSDRLRWAALAAGGLTGLGLAIGFEGLPLLTLCGAALALRHVMEADAGRALRHYGCAVAASTVVAFLVSVGPAHWFHAACDSIAVNSAAAVIAGGFSLVVASLIRSSDWRVRGAAIAGAGIVAGGVFVAIEPRCLGGPYAMVDPAVIPIWLAHISEMQPWLSLLADRPATALSCAAFPAVAVMAVIVLAARGKLRRNFGFQVASAALIFVVALMFTAIKAYAYAMWLGMPLVAALALHLSAMLRLASLVPRFFVGLLLTPTLLSAGVISIADAAGLHWPDPAMSPERAACFKNDAYVPFATLPSGLVATDIDYGPFVLALTRHSVVAAPYHRLSSGIVDAHRILSSPPDEAHRIVTKLQVDYVAICGPAAPVGLGATERSVSLWGRLRAGDVPNWLVQQPAAAGQAFAIYRVRS